jgi:disulfide bond formation protein DsbB
MDVSAVTLLYGIAAIVGIAILMWLAIMVVVSRLSEPVRFGFDGLRLRFTRYALVAAWVPAALAMLGSLYFSEIAHYQPCTLCWYQRIAMYPLAVILLVAMLRRDRAVKWYAVPVAAIGAAVSAYHYLIEWKPSFDSGSCEVTVPCTIPWFRELGFVTLAFMAFAGFAAIITLLTVRYEES